MSGEPSIGEHEARLRAVISGVRRIMKERYGLQASHITPLGASGARLSVPLRIEGIDGDGEPVIFFVKLLGSSDVVSSRSIQLAKNLYLRMNSQEPIFGDCASTEDLARHQVETMGAIHGVGIPTARPYGYHAIDDGLVIVVAEFLHAAPVPAAAVDPSVLAEAFSHMSRMHRHDIFHGDIKPENIMVGDRKVYIMDVGRFRPDAAGERKQAYDLACMICSFIGRARLEDIVGAAQRHYTRRELREAAGYIGLARKRPDLDFSVEDESRLEALMTGRP